MKTQSVNHSTEEPIEQILDRIRATIEDKKKLNEGSQLHEEKFSKSTIDQQVSAQDKGKEILELDDVIQDSCLVDSRDATLNDARDSDSDVLSSCIQGFTKKLNELSQDNRITDKDVRAIFMETLRPYLKSWLHHNLRKITKTVLEYEVRKMLKKLSSNLS